MKISKTAERLLNEIKSANAAGALPGFRRASMTVRENAAFDTLVQAGMIRQVTDKARGTGWEVVSK